MQRGLLRLDRLLVERELARSRDEAKSLIESGAVTVGGMPRTKPSSMTDRDAAIEIARADGDRWVSRGAHKLLKALDAFGIDPSGASCVDIGASTGGFTQVLLSRGASRVASVDVGYGQLAWELRVDPRVNVIERANARYLTTDDVGWVSDLLVADASFISLRLLLPNLETLIGGDGEMAVLVKPQFEAGRGGTQRGVVRSAERHIEILTGLAEFISSGTNMTLRGATHSPIKGPEGNIEFIFHMIKNGGDGAPIDMGAVVALAHEELDR